MPEITDEQMGVFNRALGLLDKIVNDPKHGMAFKKMAREAMPEAKLFPEVDIVDAATAPVTTELTALKESLGKLSEEFATSKKAAEEEKQLGTLKDRVSTASREFGLTEEGTQKMIERMTATNSTDVEAAAAWVAHQNPPAKPVTKPSYMPDTMNLFGAGESTDDASIKDLHTNPTKWFDKEVANIINHPENYPELAGAA